MSGGTRTDLRQMLANLATAGGRIRNPIVDDALKLAPQLTYDELAKAFRQAKSCEGRAYFIGPPLTVRGALQVYCLDHEHPPGEPGSIPALVLYRAFATRVPQAYEARPVPRTTRRPEDYSELRRLPLDKREEAIDYAEIHWGEHLHWDTSVGVMEGYVLYSDEEAKDGSYYIVDTFTAWLRRTWFDMSQDKEEPESGVLNDAIELLSYEIPEREEMTVGHQIDVKAYYCAVCGGPVLFNKCGYCELPFIHAAEVGREPWYSTIPLRALESLPGVHNTFRYPPREARKWEFGKWSQSTFIPPTREGCFGREQRSITFRSDECE